MPAHGLHYLIDILMFGRPYPKIHEAMDAAQASLQSNHRMFFHDDLNLEKTIILENSIEAGWSFYYHVVLDGVSDEVGQQESVPAMVNRLLNGQIPFYFSDRGLLVRIAAIGIRNARIYPSSLVPPKLPYSFK